MKLEFSYKFAKNFFDEKEITQLKPFVELANEVLVNKKGAGNDFLGWTTLPCDYDKEEFARIKKAAEKIKNNSEVLVVIGIGGSYLGAKAAIEFLSHSFYNNLPKEKRNTPEIYFAGTNMSGVYLKHLIQVSHTSYQSLSLVVCYSHLLYLQVILRMVQSFQAISSGRTCIA